MEQLITGIHHVTAIADDAQKNVDFYTGILGLRLIKKTINFDVPEVYHFYYGDEVGHPGSIITFFPYQGLARGRHGKGMLNTTSFSVSASSLNYWLERLKKFQIPFEEPFERFEGEVVVYFQDFHGLGLELVFNNNDSRAGFANGNIPLEHAVKGFYNVEIWEEDHERTAGLLTGLMDHRLIAEKGNRFRFAATDVPGNYIDILSAPDSLKGLAGSGTVHHIAFSTPNLDTQNEVRLRMEKGMFHPTPVKDRKYFSSIYFHEPGGVEFEVATAGPGFTVDEPEEHLGEDLKLPDQYEDRRKQLEKTLVPVTVNFKNDQ